MIWVRVAMSTFAVCCHGYVHVFSMNACMRTFLCVFLCVCLCVCVCMYVCMFVCVVCSSWWSQVGHTLDIRQFEPIMYSFCFFLISSAIPTSDHQGWQEDAAQL
jgi:hypothetical protein